jgi:ATP-dependent DNA ligase
VSIFNPAQCWQMPVPGRSVLPRPLVAYALARFSPAPNPFQAALILPCQPALADRPPAGPGWLHEIKFDGYGIIARKDGEQVHLWARTTSDYSNTFTRIRDAVAALPVHNAVLDGEAIVLRLDATSDFEALRSRQGRQRRSPSPVIAWLSWMPSSIVALLSPACFVRPRPHVSTA